MRRLLACTVLFALAARACDAPAPARESSRSHPDPNPTIPWQAGRGSADVLPVPPGFPAEGIAPQSAFSLRKSGIWVVGWGTVERLLRDDTKRPRHQRFVLRIDAIQTVMIAHNIDLAPRVPLKRGDPIAFRGEYVWNAQGGVVHWTHRDRRDRKAGGWIVWKGQNFR